jgi:hypothetical protein
LEEVLTPAELLGRIRRALGDAELTPDPEGVLAALAEVLENGTPSYQAADQRIDVLDRLMDTLGDSERSLLLEYEARVNEQTDRWAVDRFRVGYGLGAALGSIRS